MRGALLALCVSISIISSSAAPPRVDFEESAVMDREVVGTRDPNVWQGRQVVPMTEIDIENYRTDGRRSIDELECNSVPVRIKRSDGSMGITRMDWCD